MIVDFVAEHRDEHGVKPICAVLKDTAASIAPSRFYARTSPTRKASARASAGNDGNPVDGYGPTRWTQ